MPDSPTERPTGKHALACGLVSWAVVLVLSLAYSGDVSSRVLSPAEAFFLYLGWAIALVPATIALVLGARSLVRGVQRPWGAIGLVLGLPPFLIAVVVYMLLFADQVQRPG